VGQQVYISEPTTTNTQQQQGRGLNLFGLRIGGESTIRHARMLLSGIQIRRRQGFWIPARNTRE
jgi:hypothetical protein